MKNIGVLIAFQQPAIKISPFFFLKVFMFEWSLYGKRIRRYNLKRIGTLAKYFLSKRGICQLRRQSGSYGPLDDYASSNPIRLALSSNSAAFHISIVEFTTLPAIIQEGGGENKTKVPGGVERIPREIEPGQCSSWWGRAFPKRALSHRPYEACCNDVPATTVAAERAIYLPNLCPLLSGAQRSRNIARRERVGAGRKKNLTAVFGLQVNQSQQPEATSRDETADPLPSLTSHDPHYSIL